LSTIPNRPCPAFALTLLSKGDQLRLIAGEDFRWTLSAPAIGEWFPKWFSQLDGKKTLPELLELLEEVHRPQATELLTLLVGERLIINGPVEDSAKVTEDEVRVLFQDRLDYAELLVFNRECLRENVPSLWISNGPSTRGYVSPLVLPRDGPCHECLVRTFRRRSPIPELYDELIAHAQAKGQIAPAVFPKTAREILLKLAQWKRSLLKQPASPALFRLHVLEVATLEIGSYPVFLDPECPACCGRR
jgi:bacteriocin biosynthesis cyclodehydratase domain-containing protein